MEIKREFTAVQNGTSAAVECETDAGWITVPPGQTLAISCSTARDKLEETEHGHLDR